MLDAFRLEQQLPQLKALIEKLINLTLDWKSIPFPCFTHGQKASPSTAGKELAVYINRLSLVYQKIATHRFAGKLNGAVGNYSAMLAAFPNFDWIELSKNVIEDLGFKQNICTTQVECHDSFAHYFDLVRLFNNIVIDLNRDCWMYISRSLFSEQTKAGEVGSSTMPHKVNPINFENSEGNLQLANANLSFLSDKLTTSRMQRDLSDSTIQRN
ncbi:UNVERIFIED_CONTAM: hypothetical protein GTU68_057219, partial [Idotea baltica]|nr:hypothetical protein [Idotea baltica]